MTEDELLGGLMDALALTGWSAWHVRRSDRAVWQGQPGWPDITAMPPMSRRLLVIEVKGANGALTAAQGRWLALLHRAGITAAVVRPAGYDRALALILAGDASPGSWEWAGLA